MFDTLEAQKSWWKQSTLQRFVGSRVERVIPSQLATHFCRA